MQIQALKTVRPAVFITPERSSSFTRFTLLAVARYLARLHWPGNFWRRRPAIGIQQLKSWLTLSTLLLAFWIPLQWALPSQAHAEAEINISVPENCGALPR